MLNERWGRWHFWITYPSFFFTFFPMHLAGMLGMPRRVAQYAPEFQGINVLVSVAAFVLGLSTFIILYNMIWSLYRGERATANPWRALTLEWATSSPPPSTNFIGDPVPFPNPYGYGTKEAFTYVEALNQKYGPVSPREHAPQVGVLSIGAEADAARE